MEIDCFLLLLLPPLQDQGPSSSSSSSAVLRSDDAQCAWMVRAIFSECGGLMSGSEEDASCSAMRHDRHRAMPMLGCIFARYGDMVKLLLNKEEEEEEEE